VTRALARTTGAPAAAGGGFFASERKSSIAAGSVSDPWVSGANHGLRDARCRWPGPSEAPPTILIEDHAMKPLALPLLLTSAALLPLHVHADTLAPAPETPAAAFQRLFAHTPGPVQPPAGAAPDALTRAFNEALWSTTDQAAFDRAGLAPTAQAPESPAMAFQRMLSHTPGPVQPPVGGAPDLLTRAFNDALWSTPATAAAYASARQHTLEHAQ